MGRRTRGEGSIYKRKDGRWCGKYTDCNGKTRYVYAKTKAEVRTKLPKAIADKDAGLVYGAGTLTVGEYLDKWLEGIKDTVKDRTWVRHEQVIRLHLKPDIGKVRLSRLNALQLQNLYRNKLDTGRAWITCCKHWIASLLCPHRLARSAGTIGSYHPLVDLRPLVGR